MTRDPRYFDTIADDFGAWMNPFDLHTREEWFRTQLGELSIAGERVLDVGAGLGHFSRIIASLGGRPVPVDLAGRVLTKLRGEFPLAVQGDALALPFSAGAFNIVVSSECVEHTPDPLLAVREMLRVLRPGGRLMLSTPNRRWRWSLTVAESVGMRNFRGVENWSRRSEIRSALAANGADVVVDEGLYLFPFQFRPLWPLLAWFNRHGQRLRAWMINQCWVARKR
jgi:SAM-dependent methyltransferase